MNTKIKNSNESEYMPSVRGNPADALQTFFVTIRDTRTGELHEDMRTHHYNDEACAYSVMQNLKDGFELVHVFNPELKTKVTPKDIQKEGK
ncbi:hypothetical protein CPT_Phriendly_020 [Vibrio phage Phriendly]|nr:hypothetical protein CPT_Phriendly_020 [Vibrio phage Phriendly]